MWEDQGRQEHGRFGNGTSGNEPEAFSKADLAEVAYASVPHLAAGDRARYEGWLHRGGMGALQDAMPVWADGSHMAPDTFRTAFFGTYGNTEVAQQAQRIGSILDGAEPGPGGRLERYAAGKDLAGIVQAVGIHGMPTLMTVAARTARAARATVPSRQVRRGRGTGHAAAARPQPQSPALTRSPPEFYTEQNVQDLAALLETEAGMTLDQVALTAIAFTVINRMVRNHASSVQEIWDQYRHGKTPSAAALAAARAVLSGQAVDPVGRATHFYSPDSATTVHKWALVFPEIHVPGIPSHRYRFFAAPGDGSVR